MSGNGPIGHPGARPQVRRPLTDDPYGTPATGQPQQPHWPPRYAEPAAHQPVYGQQPTYAQPLPQGAQQSYGQDAHGQQPAPGYFFPQAAPEPQGYAPPTSGHQLPFGGPGLPPAPGYASAPQHAQTVPRGPDPQGYDLGTYMPATAPAYGPADADPYQQAHDPAHFGAPNQGYGETDADFDEMLAEEEEQPRRRRGLMIVAALVGAIGLGGAMAYTYKSLVSPSGGRAPVIKAADFGPNKVKPEAQDGKVVPHTDKKLLNRLGEEGTAPAPPARIVVPTSAPPAADPSDDPNGPRKVKVIPIPTGSAPATTASAPPRPSGPPLVAVPGVMLETGIPQMPAQQGPPPSATRATLPPPAQAPPARTMPQPPPAKTAAAKIAPAAEPAAPPRAPVAKTPVPKKPPAAEAPMATSAAGTSGYVAVLSSKKSRMDALKAFADIQQKYGDVLASKTPDVQEADLGDKGLWYRAVVGPPGSRDSASAVCSQLKTAGHTGCWVTAY
jgi:SPOR domain